MQITTGTRTVEIYMNNETGVTYRNVKDGAAYGPVRTANRATAKAGSVGREILDAIDAEVTAEVTAEVIETPAAEVAAPVATVGQVITVAGRTGKVTAVHAGRTGRAWVGVTWTTAEDGADRPSYGFAYLDEIDTPAEATSGQLSGRGTGLVPEYHRAPASRQAPRESRAAARIRRAVNLKW